MLDNDTPLVYSKVPIFTYKREYSFLSRKRVALSNEFCCYVTKLAFESFHSRLHALSMFTFLSEKGSMCVILRL